MKLIPRFPTEDAFLTAETNAKNFDLPTIIYKSPTLEHMMEEEDLKNANGVFFVQFSCSNQAKTQKGRGQIPLQTPRNDKLREIMTGFGPPMLKLMPGNSSKGHVGLKTFLSTVSNFGFLPSAFVNGEIDRFGLPSIRYQLRGKREVIAISCGEVCKFFDMQAACQQKSKDFIDVVTDLLESASTQKVQEFLDHGCVMYRGEVP